MGKRRVNGVISLKLREFCERWLIKARAYQRQDLNDCFDKFFTLFVVYNRLYMESAWILVKRGEVRLPPKGRNIPDSWAAKDYVHRFLGTSAIWSAIQNDEGCQVAVHSLGDLIDKHVFSIMLDARGEPRRQKDLQLLDNLKSNVPNRSVAAILDIIYSIRCNMFHGHKGYEPIQTQILVPVTVLLGKIVSVLYNRLNS